MDSHSGSGSEMTGVMTDMRYIRAQRGRPDYGTPSALFVAPVQVVGESIAQIHKTLAAPGAQTYALIMEDPDAKPPLHWLMWNVPARLTALPQGMQKQARLSDPDGVLQGRNSHGSSGYYGPRPPIGEGAHHYHLQVFALDAPLTIPLGSDREAPIKGMDGHVLAKGELVGTFHQATNPPLN